MWTPITRILIAFCLVVALPGCDRPDPPYRTTDQAADICARDHMVSAANFELTQSAEAAPLSAEEVQTLRRCPKQKHRLPPGVMRLGTDGSDTVLPELAQDMPDNTWTRLPGGAKLRNSDSYFLAFVEMEETAVETETGPLDLEKVQRAALTAHLDRLDRDGVQNVVIVFVHGWRHDAALRDGDVRKFRRILGYSRAALNTRCIANGTYCNAQLTGVFAGWRGRVIDEGESETSADQGAGGGLAAVGPILSFWNRYDRSVCLALGGRACKGDGPPVPRSPLKRLLGDIKGELALAPGRSSADKMLVAGHSMGGNMLATMLAEDTLAKVRAHRPGREMAPLAGDLVVLLNPASPAANWSAIQMAERRLAGFDDTDARLTCFGGSDSAVTRCSRADRSRVENWHGLYPKTQRPIYISLTTTDGWGTLKQEGRDVDYDRATARAFPLSRGVIGVAAEDHKTTIGHRLPDYASQRTVHAPAVGTSHEMTVLHGARTPDGTGFASTYANSVSPTSAWCAPADGWLLRARTTDRGQPVARNVFWDHGLAPRNADGSRPSTRNIGGSFNTAAVQWRQAQYIDQRSPHLSVSPWTSPFWNTRVLDSIIRGHSGWANYVTWCALNQLVLDDVTARGAE